MQEIDLLTGPEIKDVDVLEGKKTFIPLYNGLGGVKIVDVMPRLIPSNRTADVVITRAARISYNQGDKTPEEDAKLIRYLYRNGHTSPFEHAELEFELEMPIFVMRQLVRHRTASLNEQSFRYTKAPDKFYFPQLRMQSKNNKQGSSDEDPPMEALKIWDEIIEQNATLYKKYTQLLELGVSREVARCCLPTSLMTRVMWKVDLHNLLRFLRLRMDPHAQEEIRCLANAISELTENVFPETMKAVHDCK